MVMAMLPMFVNAFAWGQKGHDVTAYIAERHLTPATRAAVDSILDGRSLVYWANWLDNASHTADYAYTKTWHYRNVDADKSYATQPKHPDGDIIEGIRYSIRVLADTAQTHDNRALALKMLTHFLGDLHQPMHLGHATDLGGNRVKIKYFGRDANLHGVWDTNLVETAHKWSCTEWADQIDRLSPSQEVLLMSGNVDDWAKGSVENARIVYEAIPEGSNLSYNDVARWTPLIEDSLLTGGVRLAHLLNSIFDPAYPHRHTPSSF
ncbi:MAG: S1/P1 nuclease [Muribaculaceae bacterium]|nr:S1/P1 nuclease [Muribaculaceae bacterium]